MNLQSSSTYSMSPQELGCQVCALWLLAYLVWISIISVWIPVVPFPLAVLRRRSILCAILPVTPYLIRWFYSPAVHEIYVQIDYDYRKTDFDLEWAPLDHCILRSNILVSRHHQYDYQQGGIFEMRRGYLPVLRSRSSLPQKWIA